MASEYGQADDDYDHGHHFGILAALEMVHTVEGDEDENGNIMVDKNAVIDAIITLLPQPPTKAKKGK